VLHKEFTRTKTNRVDSIHKTKNKKSTQVSMTIEDHFISNQHRIISGISCYIHIKLIYGHVQV
jgi:hypothetical protein